MGNRFAAGRPTRGDFVFETSENVERISTGRAIDAKVYLNQFSCWGFSADSSFTPRAFCTVNVDDGFALRNC